MPEEDEAGEFGKSPTDGVPNAKESITVSLCLTEVKAETVRSGKRHPSEGVPRLRLVNSPPPSPHSSPHTCSEQLEEYEEQGWNADRSKSSKASRDLAEPIIPEETTGGEHKDSSPKGCCCVIV